MEYSNDAFSKNGEHTITAIGDPERKFGQRCGFSIGDIREVNKLYKCPEYNKRFSQKDLTEVLC